MFELMRKHRLVFGILLVALILRLWDLPHIPVGLHGDEASIGYNAFSLLKTARDQDGNFLPLAFDQFGNFRAAGYHYLDLPFVALFGLNALAVRLPAALFGSLTIIVFYLCVLEIFESRPIALLSAFLLAILPWHVDISRASSEGIVSLFFIVLGIWSIYRGIRKKFFHARLFIGGFLSLLISFFFYHAAGFFVPAFLAPLFIFSLPLYRHNKQKVLTAISIYVGLIVGLVLFLTLGSGSGRVSQVSIFNIPGGIKEVKQQTDEDGHQNPLISRFFHNKLYFYERLFLTFYSEHLSADFLFVNNGLPIRYRIPWTGNLYLIQAPFLILGFAILLAEGLKQKRYIYLIPIAWLLTGAMPAALTWEDLPNVVRSNLMIPALIMISAFGFYQTLDLIIAPAKRNDHYSRMCYAG